MPTGECSLHLGRRFLSPAGGGEGGDAAPGEGRLGPGLRGGAGSSSSRAPLPGVGGGDLRTGLCCGWWGGVA